MADAVRREMRRAGCGAKEFCDWDCEAARGLADDSPGPRWSSAKRTVG